MSWVTVVWSMIAAACLTLAAVHGLVWWWRRREARANVLFALTAVATAAMAASEVWLMRSGTPEEFAAAVRWMHVPAWVLVVALVGFVRRYLRAGRLWLAWTVCGVRTLSLLLNFATGINLNFREITALRHLPFLGEPVFVAVGVPNPWMLVGQLSLVLLVIFVADAGLTVWRRGDRRKALVVGGIACCVLMATGQAIMALWGILPMPITASLFYMGVVGAMGLELSREVFRTAALLGELSESEQRMTLAVDAANLGIWIRDLKSDQIWASERWRELFGFAPAEPLKMQRFFERLHPEDRDAVSRALAHAHESSGGYEKEYRILLPDGAVRWISSRGRVEFDAKGQPALVRGASRDFTARKLAEEAAHHLGGRLIHAQEEAQRQLARELHDDLSQSLALLSVELEMFSQNPPADPQTIAARMADFSSQVKGMSSEVHELSHKLHPAKLEQLGLVAAMHGFCKEFALAHEMAIEFAERDVPQMVPADAALCLYRIAQEALHNAVKHSGGTAAKVELTRDDGHLRLVVADDGAGFDPQAARTSGSLGLVSMSERARFVGGQLTIESRPGIGTRVEARVPIAAAGETASR